MTSPFIQPTPNITPKTTPGGGAALPPYLQTRRPVSPMQGIFGSYSGQQTQPIITPKSTAVPGEVKPGTTPSAPVASLQQPQAGGGLNPNAPPGGTLSDVYKFFKSDLENQRNQALASTRADASARGVFYGTPLTGSEADINTQYLRGLGQLQAGMYGNEQQNQLARLGLAESLGWQGQMNQPPLPGQLDLSALGTLFGASPAAGAARPGPTITPANAPSPTLTKQGGKLLPQPQQVY